MTENQEPTTIDPYQQSDGIYRTFGKSNAAIKLVELLLKAETNRLGAASKLYVNFINGLNALLQIEPDHKSLPELFSSWKKSYLARVDSILTEREGAGYLRNIMNSKYQNALKILIDYKKIKETMSNDLNEAG